MTLDNSNSEGAKTPTIESHNKHHGGSLSPEKVLIEYSDAKKENRNTRVHDKVSQPTNATTRYYNYLADHPDSVHSPTRTSKSPSHRRGATITTQSKLRISSASPRRRAQNQTPESSSEKTKPDRGRRQRSPDRVDPESRRRIVSAGDTSPQPDMSTALVLRNPQSAMKQNTRRNLSEGQFLPQQDEWSLTVREPSNRRHQFSDDDDDDWGDFSLIEDRANREKARSKAIAFAHGAKRRVHAREEQRERHERSRSRKTPVQSPSPRTRTRTGERRRHPESDRSPERYRSINDRPARSDPRRHDELPPPLPSDRRAPQPQSYSSSMITPDERLLSTTAVPVRFRRAAPSSNVPQDLANTSQSRRSKSTSSKDFATNREYRPLYLVERPRNDGEDYELPELPDPRNARVRERDLVQYIPGTTKKGNEVDDLLRDWTTVWE
jgi:hypothetical protein